MLCGWHAGRKSDCELNGCQEDNITEDFQAQGRERPRELAEEWLNVMQLWALAHSQTVKGWELEKSVKGTRFVKSKVGMTPGEGKRDAKKGPAFEKHIEVEMSRCLSWSVLDSQKKSDD